MDSTVVATWIQAIGSAGSLLAFAAWVGIAVINRKDEHAQRFERQAQTVAAWIDQGAPYGSENEYVVAIVNGGDAPVYRREVTLQGLPSGDQPRHVTPNVVPPRTTKTVGTPRPLAELS